MPGTPSVQAIRMLHLDADDTLTSGDEGRAVHIVSNHCEADVIIDGFNRRLNVRRYTGDAGHLAVRLRELAAEHDLGKVSVQAAEDDQTRFVEHGYVMEGLLPCQFEGKPAFFLARFLHGERRFNRDFDREDAIFRSVLDAPAQAPEPPPDGFAFEPAGRSDAAELALIYDTVFETYPSPLHDPSYIEHVMADDEIFWICRHQDRIVSATSGAVEPRRGSAEMTACATLPAFRGRGLMQALLVHLEHDLARRGYRCLYSMARAKSPGMNRAFRHLDYRFGGRLINHCHIMGDFEDMNLWVRSLES